MIRARNRSDDTYRTISEAARVAVARGVVRGDPVTELEYLGLPLRHINLLENSQFQILFLEDLVLRNQQELLQIPNFSNNMLQDVIDCLSRYDTLDDAKQHYPLRI